MRFQVGGWAAEGAKRILACLLAAAPVTIAQTQNPVRNANSQRIEAEAPFDGRAPVPILREIKDPYSPARWVIIRNVLNPAGPALIAAEDDHAQTGPSSKTGKRTPSAVIHAGNHIVVEEHTTAAESYLEAIALGAAEVGAALNVRLKIGGKVVRAVAIAPGRAALAPSREAKP